MTIARIELAYVCDLLKKTVESQQLFAEAIRDISTLEENSDKIRLILEALPSRVRLEWDNRVANISDANS